MLPPVGNGVGPGLGAHEPHGPAVQNATALGHTKQLQTRVEVGRGCVHMRREGHRHRHKEQVTPDNQPRMQVPQQAQQSNPPRNPCQSSINPGKAMPPVSR